MCIVGVSNCSNFDNWWVIFRSGDGIEFDLVCIGDVGSLFWWVWCVIY